ncbi:MAG: vWA domain-containing protein [Anaerolineae bacterium]
MLDLRKRAGVLALLVALALGNNVLAQGAAEKREMPFTNDAGRLLNVVNFLEVEGNSGTPLYDAVYRAIKVTAQQPGRRAVIVMTDGSNVGSTLKDGDPIVEAQRQHIPVFTIGLSNSRLDKSYLTRLAELTGGQFQEASSPKEIGQKFEGILSQIKVQYLLTCQSRLPEDGQLHSFLLRVKTGRG